MSEERRACKQNVIYYSYLGKKSYPPVPDAVIRSDTTHMLAHESDCNRAVSPRASVIAPLWDKRGNYITLRPSFSSNKEQQANKSTGRALRLIHYASGMQHGRRNKHTVRRTRRH